MQPGGFRPYAQQVPQRSPHVSNQHQRRGGIGPMMTSGQQGQHAAMPMNQTQLQQQQQAQNMANESAKRRSKKPTDKTIPDSIQEVIIGDGVQRYQELRDLERRLDATMTRKRLDIVDSASRNPKRYKTLRIWITNTVEDQVWQGNGLNVDSFDFSTTLESSYRVKIEGRLLDDEDEADKEGDEDTAADADRMDTDGGSGSGGGPAKPAPKAVAAAAAPAKGQRYRFSHFFKALTIDFDRSKARNGTEQSVEWKKPDRAPNAGNLPAAAEFDELTFKRNGDENTNITINLYRHEDPERFALSPILAEVVDMKEATRSEIVVGLYEYIKLMDLQDEEEKRNFRCDDLLRKVIGRDTGYIPMLQEYVNGHLKPLPPVKLVYTIRVDEEFHKDAQPTVYDIRVAVDDPLRSKLLPFVHNPQYANMLKEVAMLDDQLAVLVQAVGVSKARHSFFTALGDDPANYIRTWLSSQKRDLDVILGEATRNGSRAASGDEWRRGGRNSIWATQNAKESVNLILAKAAAPPRG